MKNRDKYLAEFFEKVIKDESCEFIRRYIITDEECDVRNCDDCSQLLKEWFDKEVETQVLTKDEVIILSNIRGFQYIYRDDVGDLVISNSEKTVDTEDPSAMLVAALAGVNFVSLPEFNHLFAFIDSQKDGGIVYNIAELLKKSEVKS